MILAAIPYLAGRVDRAVRAVLHGFGGVPLVVVLLLLAAAVPLLVEGARTQPIGQSVDSLRDGVSALSGWVRMEGRVVTLSPPENVAAGQQVHSLLIEPGGDAIVLLSDRSLEGETQITGRVSNSANAGRTARRIGGPRLPGQELDIVDQYVISVDRQIVPPPDRGWAPVWIPLGLAVLLAAGHRIGYPVVRRSRAGGSRAPAQPIAEGEGLHVRLLEPERQAGLRLEAPAGRLTRPAHPGGRAEVDPFLVVEIEGRPRPLRFMRHRWASASPGTAWTVLDHAVIAEIRDWGLEATLAFDSESDRDRLLATFTQDRPD